MRVSRNGHKDPALPQTFLSFSIIIFTLLYTEEGGLLPRLTHLYLYLIVFAPTVLLYIFMSAMETTYQSEIPCMNLTYRMPFVHGIVGQLSSQSTHRYWR